MNLINGKIQKRAKWARYPRGKGNPPTDKAHSFIY
jgi:hypothetical protein